MRTNVKGTERRGANAVEFAMTLPLFLVLVFGLIDYGYLFALQAGLDNAAALSCREGAMMDPNVGSPQAVAEAELDQRSQIFCNGSCTTTVQDLQTGSYIVPNRTLMCRVERDMDPLTGFVPMPMKIESVSYYRLEWQR